MLLPHHIVVDGGSMEILLKDLSQLYNSILVQRPQNLAQTPVQYVDYAYWQQQQVETGEVEKHICFWLAELQDAPLSVDLPAVGPRPPVFRSKGAWVPFELTEDEVGALLRLAKDIGATLLETVLSMIQVMSPDLPSMFW